MAEKSCPNCKRRYPNGHAAAVEKRRGASIRKALAASGKKLGRPSNTDDEAVAALRLVGFSIMKIADHLGISRGAVQHSLKKQAAQLATEAKDAK